MRDSLPAIGPGGPTPATSTRARPRTFKSDRTTNYELGLKGTLLDKRLSFDLAAIHAGLEGHPKLAFPR